MIQVGIIIAILIFLSACTTITSIDNPKYIMGEWKDYYGKVYICSDIKCQVVTDKPKPKGIFRIYNKE